MIMSNVRNNVNLVGRFRLLNSEIGNDHETIFTQEGPNLRFRLLNSEIGNDQMNIKTIETIFTRFRLLNSEIGNDQAD